MEFNYTREKKKKEIIKPGCSWWKESAWDIRLPSEWFCQRKSIVGSGSGLYSWQEQTLQRKAEQKVLEGEEQNTGTISVEMINTEFVERLGESMGGLAM